ncbi:cytochrome P450 4d8 [Drosophila mojavensis]|nr:cytochrome P450 4d8 [Drosophila mojavensis]
MLLIAIVVLLLTSWVHWRQRDRRAAVANLPGPFCLPLVGAWHLAINMTPKTFIERSQKYFRQLGKLQRAWVLNRLVIVSGDVEFNEQLMSSQEHLVKHPVYKLLGQWLGNGLLLSDGKLWRQRRKIITPTFHFSILEQFVEVFDQQSNVCVERLEQRATGECFDVYPFVCLAALDIISETAMGTKVHAQQAESTPYANAVTECTALMAWRFMSVIQQNELLFTLTHPHLKLRQMQLIRIMHEFTAQVIKQRRQALEAMQVAGTEQQEDEQVGGKRRMALLDVLLQARVGGRALRDEEICEEVDTFMFEGHDTTTSGISFCLWCISRHPEVQAKMLAEILEVLGSDRSRAVSMRDLGQLKYLECVIKESLRRYPPLALVGRKLQADFRYTHSKFGAGVIPSGSEIFMIIYGMHNDADYFPEPDLFKPERHESSDRSATNFSYAPFSAGPRNCVGQKFALLEMKMLLAKIVREYELLPLGEPVQPVVNIVLRSDTGFQMGMRKRGQQ